jgi:putative membrane protein
VRLLIRWVINTLVILALGYLLPDKVVSVGSVTAAVAVALVLGLLNTFARPAFVKLSLPLAPWTLGLFVFVVNGVVLRLFAWLIGENYKLGGFVWLLVLAVVISLLTTAINIAVGGDEQPAPSRRQDPPRRGRR